MKSDTLTKPVVDSLEHLEFEPVCRIRNPVEEECGHTAEWQVLLMCCGHVTVVCNGHQEMAVTDPHFNQRFRCAKCKTSLSRDIMRFERL